MTQRATITDVAKNAGVGVGTASDALNGRGRMSDVTRQRVNDVAASMGYRARSSARALRRGTSMCIGLRFGARLAPQAEFVVDLINGAATAAHRNGYGLVISAPELDELQIVDGLIVVDPVSEHDVAVPGLNVLTVGRSQAHQRFPSVDLDYDVTVSLLLDRDVLPPGPVWLLSDVGAASYSWDVARSVITWANRARRTVQVVPMAAGIRPISPDLERATDQFGPPALIFAASAGHHAAEAQRFMQSRGMRVPEDVVVVATVADSATITCDPPIRAVEGHGFEHGQCAVQAMVRWLDTGDEPEDIVLQPRLWSPPSPTPA